MRYIRSTNILQMADSDSVTVPCTNRCESLTLEAIRVVNVQLNSHHKSRMQSEIVTDFHRGWMIRIEVVETGFQNTCYSPTGKRVVDSKLYSYKHEAWQAAIALIDEFLACCLLKQGLRDIYEAGRLPFEEWCHLNQFLTARLQLSTGSP